MKSSSAIEEKARAAGFHSLNDPWRPGYYVDMNAPVMKEWVKIAIPIGEKSINAVSIVDRALFRMCED